MWLVGLAPAQQSSGTGGAGSGAGAGTKTPPPTTTPTPTRPAVPPLAQPQQVPRIIYVTGRVVMDDGNPPPESVSIERVCGGRARREGYTDHSGNFSLQLGQSLGVMQDASVGTTDMGFPGQTTRPLGMPSQGVTEQELMNCELRASLPGTWSDVLLLAGRRYGDNPNVGTIVLHRVGKVEGTKVSVSSLKAPKDAKKALERADKAVAKQKWQDAQTDLEKAVGLYPDYAEAWVKLGFVYATQERAADARKAYEKANSIDPKYMEPYFHLAILSAQQQDWPKVATLTDQALALDAFEYPAAYYYNAVAYFNLHDLDRAEKSARAARRLDTQYRIPKIDLILSSVLFQKQDYAAAAQQLREFLKHAPEGPDAARARTALADVEQRMAAAGPVKPAAPTQPPKQ